MKDFVKDFVENYDVDGIEYDFFRHGQLFKTVGWGAYATEAQLELMTEFMLELRAITEAAGRKKGKPILVDCWATWCKNCFAMDRTTLADKRVREALAGYTVIRLQADDMKGFKELKPFKDVQGLPAYAIFEISETGKDTEK